MRYLLTVYFSLKKPLHHTASRIKARKMIGVINLLFVTVHSRLLGVIYMEKTCLGSEYSVGSLAYPSYPGGRANVSHISLQNVANRLHYGMVTLLAGKPGQLFFI